MSFAIIGAGLGAAAGAIGTGAAAVGGALGSAAGAVGTGLAAAGILRRRKKS